MGIKRRIQSFLNREYCCFCAPLDWGKEDSSERTAKLQRLEDTISQMMISALSPENDPDRKNIYINIQEKNEQEDVVFFLLTTVAKHFGSSMEELLQQIKKCSILPNWENITTFEEYQTALSNFITTKQEELPNKDVKNIVLTSEGMSYYQMMGNLLSQQGKSSVFLFFDHIDTLSPEEQQRINTLISTRWQLGLDARVVAFVKINNGKKWWKSYMNTKYHPIQDPHDYATHSVPLEEI